MKTTVIYMSNYHLKEDVKNFFKVHYGVTINGVNYPTMNYHISDSYDDGYRVEFTADNKDTAFITRSIDQLNKHVYTCEI